MNIRVFGALYIVATSHILTFWCSIPRVSAAFSIQLSIFCSIFTLPAFIGANSELIVLPQLPTTSESVACMKIGVAPGIRGTCFKIWSYCR